MAKRKPCAALADVINAPSPFGEGGPYALVPVETLEGRRENLNQANKLSRTYPSRQPPPQSLRGRSAGARRGR